jgi:DNA processing protein
MDGLASTSDRDRLATVGLWAVPGLGPKALEAISALGRFGDLLEKPIESWLGELKFELNAPVRARLLQLGTLAAVTESVLARARKGQMEIAFQDDPLYPERLRGERDAPPLLFVRGRPSAPRKWVALVGARKPDVGFHPYAQAFAYELGRAGIGIVSGAAAGIDELCHAGAVAAGAPTWAFVGSALDELDPKQAKQEGPILAGGGAFFSELPPGVRASPATFPRRNRLISGSADVVVVLRAAEGSGSLHTALAAVEQGRPLLALPGDVRNEMAAGCNQLIRAGRARICLGVEDVFAALRMRDVPSKVAREPVADSPLSDEARRALAALAREPRAFEEVRGACGLASGALTSALCELELFGLAVQHPGKMYEKV